MHGQNLAPKSGVMYALNSPPPVLPSGGSQLRCASAIPLLVEVRPSIRPFTHRRRQPALRTGPRSRVNAPGLHLRSNTEPIRGPFGFRLPPPLRFLCRAERVRRLNPLPILDSESAVCPQPSAPLQDLSILRDRSAPAESNRRNLPLWVARSSFAPRFAETFDRHETNQSPGSATSHQARCP